MQANPNQQMCCDWAPQPFDTNPNSLDDPNGTPLGFSLLEYHGTDSDQPDLCVRVSYPTSLNNVRIGYVVAAVSLNYTCTCTCNYVPILHVRTCI